MSRVVDHIVYCVLNLEQACEELTKSLGISPVFGGYHRTQGTKNALLNLSSGCYLEILARDDLSQIASPRWMGIDLISASTITRWALKSTALHDDQSILQSINSEMDTIHHGNRDTASGGKLSWEMILPRASPTVELIPFMVDWSTSPSHPCDDLDAGCHLVGLEFRHPQPGDINSAFNKLGINSSVIQAATPQIVATISGPHGTVVIGG